eukprot:GEMP01000807.1.p1 GENE.GEMP01000807.1~~GEMP01000807.1.p1  ORF type:complete len:1970 (+),score=436.25 GEMP01000807.1:77-5986(+)
MKDYFQQVRSLLYKDLLLKKRRTFSTGCDCLCPILAHVLIIIAFLASPDTDKNLTPRIVPSEGPLLDATGASNIAHPFPMECLGERQESRKAPDAPLPMLHATEAFVNALPPSIKDIARETVQHPGQNWTQKKFVIGPTGDVATLLRAYFANRINTQPRTTYETLTQCFRANTTVDCLSDATVALQCLGACQAPGTRRLNAPDAHRSSDHDDRDSQAGTKRSTDVSSSGATLTRPNHGRRLADKDGHSLNETWEEIGKRLTSRWPTMVDVKSNADLDARAAADGSFCGGVVFDATSPRDISTTASYTLRIPTSDRKPTPLFTVLPDFLTFLFETSPALYLQRAIDDFVTCNRSSECLGAPNFASGDSAAHDGKLRVTPFPIAAKRDSVTLLTIGQSGGEMYSMIVFILALIWSVHLLREKEWKVRDVMQAHGVKTSAYYGALVIFMAAWTFACSIAPSIVIAYLPSVNGYAFDTGVWAFFVLMWLALWNAYSLVAFLTVFFSRVYPAVFFIFVILGFSQNILNQMAADSSSRAFILFASLHPAVNWARSLRTIGPLNISLRPNDWVAQVDFFSLGDSAVMHIVAIALWHILMLYFDLVMNMRYRWYFILSPASWRSAFGATKVTGGRLTVVEEQEKEQQRSEDSRKVQPPSKIEMDAAANNRMVEISNITKKFGDFTAVDSISANIYAGEIFALLGHNGAGKTTTFSMLSGMNASTSGSITLFGLPLSEHLSRNRSKVGMCPQQNLVWPLLSVNEHIRLFSSLKGITTTKESEAEVDSLLTLLGLGDKKQALVSTLSGGMIRKLCLALSFLGDPELLLLDEPTSGLDPTARREVWNLLLSRKHNRVVILSTHYMEEADALGDRVAIMNHGRIECNGSPTFLKDKYGCGYDLTCLMVPSAAGDILSSKHKVFRMIHTYLNPSAENDDATRSEPVQVLTNVGREVTFLLRFSAAEHFPALFKLLNDSPVVESYSVGVSNLEEVFLKIASGQSADVAADNGAAHMTAIAKGCDDMSGIGGTAHGGASFSQQLNACATKRLYYAKRNLGSEAMKLLIPLIFAVMAIVVANTNQLTDVVTLNPMGEDLIVPAARTVLVRSGPQPGNIANAIKVAQNTEFRGISPEWDLDVVSSLNQADCHGSHINRTAAALDSNKGADDGTLRYDAFIFPQESCAQDGSVAYAMANLEAREAPGISVNRFSNVMLAASNKSGRIVARKQMIPLPDDEQSFRVKVKASNLLPSSLMVGLGIMTILCSTLVLFEKDNGIFTHQASVGVRAAPYWLSFWICDVVTSLCATFLVLPVFAVADLSAFVGTDYGQLGYVFILFIMFALAQPLFCYTVCQLFKQGSSAAMCIFMFTNVTGPIILLIGYLLDELWSKRTFANTAGWHTLTVTIMWVYRLIPSFALASGLRDIQYLIDGFWLNDPVGNFDTAYFDQCEKDSAVQKRYALECARDLWDPIRGPGRNLLMLAVSLLFWPALMVLLHYFRNAQWWKDFRNVYAAPLSQPGGTMKDNDVCAEEARIAKIISSTVPGIDKEAVQMEEGAGATAPSSEEDAIVVYNARKVWKTKRNYVHAVQGTSFAASAGDVFGLLGVNGAGKSTMFKMLAGEVQPIKEAGSALRVRTERGVGYCPQHDPLWPFMTVREHLVFTAQAKGIAVSDVPTVVADLLPALDLQNYANVLSHALSGGNKRKLCVAMSLVGTPHILFLDEPSAGVDPLARRFMWGVIQQVSERDKSTTVVLTTHSMEECEALCTTTAIMVNGVFRCIGPNARIRDVYGEGSTLDVSFQLPPADAHQELLTQWHLPDTASMVTYAQLSAACQGDAYAWHRHLLHSSASCFPTIVGLAAEKKAFDALTPSDANRVAASIVPSQAATQWWHSIQMCGAFVGKLRTRVAGEKSTDGAGDVIVEEVQGEKVRLRVHVAQTGVSKMDDLFEAMEEYKKQRVVEDYTLSRATLESIFNKFAREPVLNTSCV